MRFGSLFSGIGGLDLGLEWAGMTCDWQVENNPYCQRVLEKHWPEVPRDGDITAVDFRGLPAVDLICGGFPCQPTSHAGKRLGAADMRWLWPEMLRAVVEARPRFVVAENVYGLVTHDGGALIETVYADLDAAGYETLPPVVFPAAALGAPHRRDRVWILAHARHDNWGTEQGQQQTQRAEVAHRGGSAVAHSDGCRCRRGQNIERCKETERGRLVFSGQAVEHPYRARCGVAGEGEQGRWLASEGQSACRAVGSTGWWDVEPGVGRVAHGVPRRVDRLRGLGNAVVPQVAEFIGRALLAALETATPRASHPGT